ncbi:Ff.00g090580.m01.CDS01 [Fusarium sp. VM40]|nr:Ff.00g090580.m01.CDS01 [Fusarium sp. VM40]
MTTSEVNSLNILDLPVDILSIILKPLVTSSTPIHLCPCTLSPIDPLPILLSHPALHTIATPLLYAGNEFLLDATGSHAQHIRRELQSAPLGADERLPGRATLLTTPDALQRIARVELRIDRLRGWLGTDIAPLLTKLAVQGRMDYLTVWVRTPAESKTPLHFRPVKPGKDKDMGMFARPPLEGLLRVLADPYLLSARLWVDAHHAKTWCRFHAGICGAESGVPGREPERERRMEIDWREIIRVVDPERKEIAVIGTEKKW